MSNGNSFNVYNTCSQLNMFAYNCISYLLENNEDIWKLLYYMSPYALEMANLTMQQKRSLIYNGQEDSSKFRIFIDGGSNDAFTSECTILKIYPIVVIPDNRIIGTTSILFECISHYKQNTLDNYSTRTLTMVTELIKSLNGADIGGLGYLSMDRQISPYNKVNFDINDDKAYSGYSLVMSVKTL